MTSYFTNLKGSTVMHYNNASNWYLANDEATYQVSVAYITNKPDGLPRDDLRQVLLLSGGLGLEPVDLVDAAAEASDDRMEEQGIDGRPGASELAVRGSEDVGQGREEEAEGEGQEEPDEAW